LKSSAPDKKVCPHLRHFDSLYAHDADPWRVRSSWNEEFKRRTVNHALGPQRLATGLEIGCGNGISTRALAPRFAHLLAIDGSWKAVEHARREVASFHHVSVVLAWLPVRVAAGRLDAVVASEVLYYLPSRVLINTLEEAHAGLKVGGRLVSTNHLKRFSDAECGQVRLTALTRAIFGCESRSLIGSDWRCDVFLKH
jgi:SAM-dependent methyltransferase